MLGLRGSRCPLRLVRLFGGFRASLRVQLGGSRPVWVLMAAGSAGRSNFPGYGCAGELRAARTPLIPSPALPSSSKQCGHIPVTSWEWFLA